MRCLKPGTGPHQGRHAVGDADGMGLLLTLAIRRSAICTLTHIFGGRRGAIRAGSLALGRRQPQGHRMFPTVVDES